MLHRPRCLPRLLSAVGSGSRALMVAGLACLGLLGAAELLPPGTGTGLHATYRGNMDFTGGVVQVVDPVIDHAWGVDQSPIAGIEPKTYSIIWKGSLEARSTETYTIATLCDDGVRVIIDGVTVITNTANNWDGTNVRRHQANVALTAGHHHDIEVRYYQNRGTAIMRLLWSSPSIPEEVIPASQLHVAPATPATLSPPADGTGLRAQYWGNMNFTGGVVERTDPLVDFAWGVNEAPIPTIEAKTYSISWRGKLRARSTERYFISTLADDGVRVVVDGVTIINDTSNNWDGTKVRRNAGELDLVADTDYTIEVFYYQNRGTATMQLLWSTPTIAEEIIPTSQLFVIPPDLATLSPPADGTGLRAQYWGNMNFTGGLVERTDPLLDFAWDVNEAPTPTIEPKTYSISWRGKLRPRSTERYVISTLADDGVRVVINGVTVINDTSNNWDGTHVRRNGTVLDLVADTDVTIEVHYYQNRGTATMQLLWSSPTIAEEVIPTSQLFVIPPDLATLSPPGNGTGLCSKWWDHSDFTNLIVQEVDPVVDHAWSLNQAPKSGMGSNYYSVTWTGKILARSTERYVLSTLSDDGVRVVVDGVTVINDTSNNWDGTKVRRNGAVFDWTADSYHSVEVWYYQTRGTATMQLLWSTPTIAEEIIPTTQLFPATTIPEVTWAAPAAIVYGTALSSAQLNASAAIPGTLTYDPPAGTVLPAGEHTLSVTFVAADQATCADVTLTVPLTVVPATPVTSWPQPEPIAWGTPLSEAQLAATASVPGTWVYTPPAGTLVDVGTTTLDAIFLPTDDANYHQVAMQVPLTVVPATPILTWDAPLAITYGTPLGAAQLRAESAVDGTFTYTPDTGTVLPVGTHPLSVSFAPADSLRYTTATATASVEVLPATPVITWPTPAAIVEGAALTALQLQATASVSGSFVYAPDVGTILPVGSHTLTATFTPADTVNYLGTSATVTLVVVAEGGGGGEDPPGMTPPQVTLAITGGLSGDEQGDLDGVPTYFSKHAALTVTVTVVPAADSPVSLVRVTTGATVVDLAAGVTTATVELPEGSYDLVAEAVTVGGAVGVSDAKHVLIDRTPPQVLSLDSLPASDSDEAPIRLQAGATGTRDYHTLRLGNGDPAIVAAWRSQWTLPVYSIQAFVARATADDPLLKEVTFGWAAAPLTVAVPVDEDHPEVVTVPWVAGPSAGNITLNLRASDRAGNVSDVVTYPVVFQDEEPSESNAGIGTTNQELDQAVILAFGSNTPAPLVEFRIDDVVAAYPIAPGIILSETNLTLGVDGLWEGIYGYPDPIERTTWTVTDSCGNRGSVLDGRYVVEGYFEYDIGGIGWTTIYQAWDEILGWNEVWVDEVVHEFWDIGVNSAPQARYRGAGVQGHLHHISLSSFQFGDDAWFDWTKMPFSATEGWRFLVTGYDPVPKPPADFNVARDPSVSHDSWTTDPVTFSGPVFTARDFANYSPEIADHPPVHPEQRALHAPIPVFCDDVGEGAQRRIHPAVLNAPPSWASDAEGGQPWHLEWSDNVLRQGATFGLFTAEDDYEGPWDIGVRTLSGSHARNLPARFLTPGILAVDPQAWGDDRRNLAGALSLRYRNPSVVLGAEPYLLERPWTADWVSVVRLDNDVQASGAATTLRFIGGFAADGVVPTQEDLDGSTVRFLSAAGTDLTLTAADEAQEDESGKIRITGLRLTPNPEHWQAAQLLEVDVVIGSAVAAALYHVDLKLGAVKAYPEGLSQQYVGAEGAHRMREGLAIIRRTFQAIQPDGTIADLVNDAVPISDLHPTIHITATDFQADADQAQEGRLTGTFHVSGTLGSAICDRTPGAAGTIPAVAAYLNGGAAPFADIPVAVTKGEQDVLGRPYPFSGTFTTAVPVELVIGPNEIIIEAQETVLGKVGWARISINVQGPGRRDLPTPSGILLLAQPFAAELDLTDVDLDLVAQGLTHIPISVRDRYDESAAPILDGLTRAGVHRLSLAGERVAMQVIEADLIAARTGQMDTFTGIVDVPELSYRAIPLVFRRSTGDLFVTDDLRVQIGRDGGPGNNIQIDIDGGAGEADGTGYPQSDGSYQTADGGITVTITEHDPVGPGQPGAITATIDVPALGIEGHVVDLEETEPGSGLYDSDAVTPGVNNADDEDVPLELYASYPEVISEDAAEDYQPVVLAVEGPEVLLADPAYRLETYHGDYPLVLDPTTGERFLATPDGSKPEAIVVLPQQVVGRDTTSADIPALPSLRSDYPVVRSAEFLTGFVTGFSSGAVSLVSSAGELIGEIWLQAGLGWLSLAPGELGQDAEDLAIARYEAGFEVVSSVATAVHGLVRNLIERRDEIVIAVITRDRAKLAGLSEEYAAMLEFAAELVDEAIDIYAGLTPFEQGDLFGGMLFEVASSVASFAKAGKLMHLSKSQGLSKAVGFMRGRLWQAGSQWAARLSSGAKTRLLMVLDRASLWIHRLTTTKMCFVAGTPIWTADGWRPIENVGVGDQVWSRCAVTGAVALRPVRSRVVTHPHVLHTIRYRTGHVRDAEESGRDADEPPGLTHALVCTGEHPFFVQDRQSFVEARSLRVGYRLMLADGTTATVVSNTSESASSGQTFTTYNFEVAEFHTYFAGWGGVWVHNSGRECERFFTLATRMADRDNINLVEAAGKAEAKLPKISHAVKHQGYSDSIKSVLNGERVPAGLDGPGFDSWLRSKLGGTTEIIPDPNSPGNNLSDVDCLVGRRWMECKHRNPAGPPLTETHPFIADTKNQLTNQWLLAAERNQTLELVTNFDLPSGMQSWLKAHDIPWTKLDN